MMLEPLFSLLSLHLLVRGVSKGLPTHGARRAAVRRGESFAITDLQVTDPDGFTASLLAWTSTQGQGRQALGFLLEGTANSVCWPLELFQWVGW